MVTDNQSNQLTVSQASCLRQQANELLDRLVADREQSERRFAEAGKRDPMKFITGRTALDSAIASTREMISNMDVLLERLIAEFEPMDTVRSQLRPVRMPTRAPLRPANPVRAMANGYSEPVSNLK